MHPNIPDDFVVRAEMDSDLDVFDLFDDVYHLRDVAIRVFFLKKKKQFIFIFIHFFISIMFRLSAVRIKMTF